MKAATRVIIVLGIVAAITGCAIISSQDRIYVASFGSPTIEPLRQIGQSEQKSVSSDAVQPGLVGNGLKLPEFKTPATTPPKDIQPPASLDGCRGFVMPVVGRKPQLPDNFGELMKKDPDKAVRTMADLIKQQNSYINDLQAKLFIEYRRYLVNCKNTQK